MTSVDMIACNIKMGSDDFEEIKRRIQDIIAGIIGCDASADLDEEISVLLIAPVRYSCKRPLMKVVVCTDEESQERCDIQRAIEAELEETDVRLQVAVIKELSAH